MKAKIIDITEKVAQAFNDAGFGNDSNNEKDISKAGMFDVMDALSGQDNSKFSKEEARKEFEKRMGESKCITGMH